MVRQALAEELATKGAEATEAARVQAKVEREGSIHAKIGVAVT